MHDNVSCKISNAILNYVERRSPELITPLTDKLPYPYEHLIDTDKWIPWDVLRELERRMVSLFNDELVMREVGKSVMSHKTLGIINILFKLVTTPEGLYHYAPKVSKYFSKGLVDVYILESSSQGVTVKLVINGKQTRGSCLFNQGMFSVGTEIFGIGAADIDEVQCMVPFHEIGTGEQRIHAPGNGSSDTVFGTDSCIFRLSWNYTSRSLFSRDKAGSKQALKDAMSQLEENYDKLQSAYKDLRSSEERYRDLMENATDIICIIDPDGTIASINRVGQDLLGNISGGNFIEILEDSYREETLNYLERGLASPQPAHEVIAISADRGRLVLSISPTSILQDGVTVGLMIIARNITKEKEMSARLIEAERFAAKGIVAAEIAHEINNSLANIETTLYIINKLKVDPDYKNEMSATVIEEIDRMSSIVRGILEVYSTDDSKIQHVDVNQEILKVINFTSRRLKGKGITVMPKLSKSAPSFPCFPGHLKQILLNIIKNAEDAIENSDSKMIIIASEEDEENVRILVQDTGHGIPDDLIDKVTMKLFTTKSTGIGLGLSVCKQLVEKYNGDINLKSKEGVGTTVTMSFPKVINV